MKLTRVKAYLNGEFTTFEIVYFTDSHAEALHKFRVEFPNMNECILIAETLNTENEKDNRFIETCVKCGAFR